MKRRLPQAEPPLDRPWPTQHNAIGNERFAKNVLPRIPMRRWGTGDDFGGIAVYLVSSASRYHTGDTFLIDGGYALF